MSTRNLAFSGVICALSSACIIFSSIFHLIFPLVIACVFYYVCAYKCGKLCALIVVIASNLIGFFIGGFSGGEILFSVLLFSPFAIIVYLTAELSQTLLQYFIRAVIFAAFSMIIYLLFATILKDLVGFDGAQFGLGVYAFGVIWTGVMTLFGFALDKGAKIIMKRFLKK